MTPELRFRWRCSAQLARRKNPALGSASLRAKAIEIYESRRATKTIRAESGPLPGHPTASGIRFKRIEMIGNVLTAAGRQAAGRSRSISGPSPGSLGGS